MIYSDVVIMFCDIDSMIYVHCNIFCILPTFDLISYFAFSSINFTYNAVDLNYSHIALMQFKRIV